MTFNELYSLYITESRPFIGEYELNIDNLRNLLDRNGWIKIKDRSMGKNVNFAQEYIKPIIDFLKENGEDVDFNLNRHSLMGTEWEYVIRRNIQKEPIPELEPWELTKKRLEKQRVQRGFAHPGKSASIMNKKVERQKSYGYPTDNTFGYGLKDSTGRPKHLGK
jgi:hypothetical protein